MAAAIMALHTAGTTTPAASTSEQAAYDRCLAKCSADAACKSWDWDRATGVCHLAQTAYPVPPQVAGPKPPPPTPNPALEKLIAKYAAMQNASCGQVAKQVPALNPADATAFMAAYQNFKGNGSEAAVFAAAAKLMSSDVEKFLALPDSITAGGLDAAMVQCAVLSDAVAGRGWSPAGQVTPNALAKYAVLGATQEAVVDQLLSNAPLMRDMLVAGGASGGNYGQAAAIYAELTKQSSELRAVAAAWDARAHGAAAAAAPPAPPLPPLPPCPAAGASAWDDREPATVLRRLALGIALSNAMPITHRSGTVLPNGTKVRTTVDPVERYNQFASHYTAGDLDPAFPILTTFELSHAVDSDGTEDEQLWARATMGNYRPDEIAMSYSWRYCESVHSEVAYGDSQCKSFPGGVCSGHYSDIPVGGDVCGGRAFWGRFVRKAFGLPTWGATEKGHASMASWTPTGWIRQLGSAWPFCWWGARGGTDFYLETQVRDNRCEYQTILRGGWVASALGEDPVSLRWTGDGQYNTQNGQGGIWSALMLYRKKITAGTSPAPNRTIPAAVPPIVNKIDALIARSKQPAPPNPPPSTGADGTIAIPAVSFTSKNRSASLDVQNSFEAGRQLLHGGCSSPVGPPCLEPLSSSWTYDFTAAAAGSHYLTANFTTYHYAQDLYVSVNGAKAVEVPIYYSVGWWNQSTPIEVALTTGQNSLTFTRTSTREVVFNEFLLYREKPVVPQPPGNFTPPPAPPPAPPGGAYIEVPADTTCTAQGIAPVPADQCSHACFALGFKSTGARARPNISGCFVMTTGEYAGNCNYNSNTSATCTPPCTLYGSVVRSLCIR